jgi:hypothetical protein
MGLTALGISVALVLFELLIVCVHLTIGLRSLPNTKERDIHLSMVMGEGVSQRCFGFRIGGHCSGAHYDNCTTVTSRPSETHKKF